MKKQLQRLMLLVMVGISLGGCSTTPSVQYFPAHYPGKHSVRLQQHEPLKPAFHPKKIALLLPLSGPLASAGQAVLQGFLANYYVNDDYTHDSDKPVLDILDTHKLGAKGALTKAVQDQVDFIIGPLSRQYVQAVINQPHNNIPWLTLNYAQTDSTDRTIYQFGLSAEDETAYIARQAWAAGYRHPLLIVDKSALGQRVATQFKKVWNQLGSSVADIVSVGRKENENRAVADALLVNESQERAISLRKLLLRQIDFTIRRRKDIDMVFIQASAAQARQIRPALKFYFAGRLPVLSLSSIYNGLPSPYRNKDLNGVYFTATPWQLNSLPLMKTIKKAWPDSTYANLNNLYAMGIDAGHIYPYLMQLRQSPGASLMGYTGQIFMDAHQHLHRQLRWATFRKGKVIMKTLPVQASTTTTMAVQ